jgi:hypothetical protein
MKIEIEYPTPVLTETWLLNFHFDFFQITHPSMNARAHFHSRFHLAGLPDSDAYLSKLLSGATSLSLEGWAIVAHDADERDIRGICKTQREKWAVICNKRASK